MPRPFSAHLLALQGVPEPGVTMLVKGHPEIPKKIPKILLFQLGDLGDVVLTMPTIRALRENFPESRLYVAVREKARGLLEDCPWIEEIIYINKDRRSLLKGIAFQKAFLAGLRKKHILLSIELRTGTRGAILSYLSGATYRIGRYTQDGKLWRNKLFTHLVQPANELSQYCAEHGLNILAPFGVQTDHRSPQLFVSSETAQRASAILEQEKVPSHRPIVAVQPFSLWRYKEWATANYAKLIGWIGARFSFSVILLGSADERERADEIVKTSGSHVYNLAGKTPLGELAAILRACCLFIGGDSAGIHIAAAVGTPTVSLFGPSAPESWAPRGEQHRAIQKNWPCVPCRQKGCKNSERSLCLEELKLADVRAVVEEHILRLMYSHCGT
jgi:predicted lipopolysaccharide heptosyltransferase III